jgi:hypothetical protein
VCALIVIEASERPNTFALRLALGVNLGPLVHWEEQRLRIIEKWSAELLCTLITLASFAWRDSSITDRFVSCKNYANPSKPIRSLDTDDVVFAEACEGFWMSAGGPPHDGTDDEAHKFWMGFISAAKRAPRIVWSAVLGSTPAGRMILQVIPEGTITSMPRSERRAWYEAPQTVSIDAQWVVKVKSQMLECLRAGRAGTAAELARELNLVTSLAERLLRELEKEKLWPFSQPAVPQNL